MWSGRGARAGGWMLTVGGVLLLTVTAAAQTVQPVPAATAGKTSVPTGHASRHVAHPHAGHKKRHASKKKTEPVVIAPVTPPPPLPPAQRAAEPATITFQRGTLRIVAKNSSLVQILHEVSKKSGLTIDGLNRDERIYGQYGPGPVASTLTKLLDGAGYNYVIIGGEAGGKPMKLVLTAGNNMPPSVSATPYRQPVATPEPEDPSAPVHAKTPQEIFDELRAMRPRHQRPQ